VASFVIDEDMSMSLARLLRERGHEAIHVREAGLNGQPDEIIFAFAQERRATLVTEDLGFGDLRKYPVRTHAGIILLRMPEQLPYSAHNRRVFQVLDEELEEGLAGCLLVVEPATVRRRSA
jgi:predicted nuclease of predicted toxin-antitoxin system